MKIYTRTGDDGTTSLASGQRVKKNCTRIEAYGTIDELTSHIGLLIAYCDQAEDKEYLTDVQSKLFIIGGYIATDTSQGDAPSRPAVSSEAVSEMEQHIDAINAIIPPFKCFILPGGSIAASQAHVCRTVCRRAERRILDLREEGAEVDNQCINYVNRLSDYLFVLARKINMDENHPEIIWKRK